MFPGRLKLWIHRWFSFDWVGAVYPRLFLSIHKPARFKALAWNRGLLCQSAWDSVELIKKSRNSPASLRYPRPRIIEKTRWINKRHEYNYNYCYYYFYYYFILLLLFKYFAVFQLVQVFRCFGVPVFLCCSVFQRVPAYSGLFQRVPVFLMFTVSLFIPCRFSRQTKQFSGFHDEPWSLQPKLFLVLRIKIILICKQILASTVVKKESLSTPP